MVTPKGSMSTKGATLQVSVLPYRCSICPHLVTRQMSNLAILAISNIQNAFLFPVHAMFSYDCPLVVKPASTPQRPVHKKNLGRFSAYWYAPFCCACLGCCTAVFWISGRTYELTCVYIYIYIERERERERERLIQTWIYILSIWKPDVGYLCTSTRL